MELLADGLSPPPPDVQPFRAPETSDSMLARDGGAALTAAKSFGFTAPANIQLPDRSNTNMKTEERLTKARLASAIADRSILSKKTILTIMDQFAELAYQQTKPTFKIPGIGKLMVVNRAARKARNPKTGEEIMLPPQRVLKFRVSQFAKDAILGKKPAKK
jgi:DNA-binding protein HU-beta